MSFKYLSDLKSTIYLGRLTSTEQGRIVLEKQDARSMLLSLLSNRMDVYLKLVVSCVDYRYVLVSYIVKGRC